MDCLGALEFCREAHAGQLDKAGEPYWKHPAAVAALLENPDDELIQIALLHDVIEDAEHDAASLAQAGFSPRVVAGVVALSRPSHLFYSDWIFALATCGNQDAAAVKMADIAHNLQPERLAALDVRTAARLVAKYERALGIMKQYPPGLSHKAE